MSAQIPRIGIGVLIFNDKKQVLLSQRLAEHGNGTWCPPGGHLEFHEKIEECAIRETIEETGLNIEDIKVLDFLEDFYPEKHYITFITTGTICGGSIINPEPHKHTEWQWFDWDDLPSPLMLSTENFVKKYPKCPI